MKESVGGNLWEKAGRVGRIIRRQMSGSAGTKKGDTRDTDTSVFVDDARLHQRRPTASPPLIGSIWHVVMSTKGKHDTLAWGMDTSGP